MMITHWEAEDQGLLQVTPEAPEAPEAPEQFTVTVRLNPWTVDPNGQGSAVYDMEGDFIFNTPFPLDPRTAQWAITLWLNAYDQGKAYGEQSKIFEIRRVLEL